MRCFVGTSGYAYKEWKGSFYPKDLPAAKMLPFYAEHFATTEINNTFYRMPTAALVKSWAAEVPASFRFAVKAPQTITHFKRLKDAAPALQFIKIAATLKVRLGPLFFQLPGNFKKDVPRLDAFLTKLPKGHKIAFEFRHESWFDAETYACLKEHAVALCAADTEDGPPVQLIATTNFGYIRLRRGKYSPRQLADWARKIQAMKWKQAYIYFMHEDTGTGPKFAATFLKSIDP